MGNYVIRTDSYFKEKLTEIVKANGLKSVEQLCTKLISDLSIQIVEKLKKMPFSEAIKYIDSIYADYSSTTTVSLQKAELSIRLNAISDYYIHQCMDACNSGDRGKSDVIRILLAIGLLYLEDSKQVLKEFKISSINMQFPSVCYQHGNKENPNIKPEITKILQQVSANIPTDESDITPINISPTNVYRQDDKKEDSDIETIDTETATILHKLPVNIDTVVEPFMGMGGLTLNVLDTFSGQKLNYYANDADVNLINLYCCIQHKPNKMMLACERLIKKLKTGNDTFETIKARHRSEKKMLKHDYNAAADYMYLDAVSTRHKTDNLKKKNKECISVELEIEYFHEYVTNILRMHQYLERINISKKDALAVLKNFKNVMNVLFLFDPPYLDSCGYSKKTNGVKDFTDENYEELIKFCLNVPDGSIFLLFCRFTQTRSGKRGETDEDIRAKEMNGDFKIGDKKLEGYYRRRFGVKAQLAEKQFYYKKISFDGKGTIEAIISNYQFDGFIPF